MAEGCDNRQPRVEDRARDQLSVERIHLLEAASASREHDHVRDLLLVAAPKGAGHAHGRSCALDLHRVEDDAHVRVAVPDRLLEVVDHSACRRREEGDVVRKKREGSLSFGIECALQLQASLELLQASAQLADVVELDLVDDEREPARLAEEVDATSKDEYLAVLRQRGDTPGVVRKKHRIEPAEAVLNREVVVPGGATLHAADLAFQKERGQGTELAADLVGELGDRVRSLSFLGFQHGD